MKILIVTVHFPPENVVASLRLYSFAYYWHIAGHNITILTATKNKKDTDLEFDCSAFKIIEIPIPIISKFQRFNSNSNNISNINKLEYFFKLIFFPFKILFKTISNKTGCFSERFPSFTDLWTKKAIKLINAFDFDVVLSSGGPYSVHRVGLSLKKLNKNIKWIVDWRDLWLKNPSYKGLRIFHFHEKKLEKIFHNNANLITCVSEPNSNILSNTTATSVKTIYNGFLPIQSIRSNVNNNKEIDKFIIVYTGSIYRDLQDPSPIFDAISRIKSKNINLYNKLLIQFAGLSSNIIDIIKKYNIIDCYNYLGYVKLEESLILQYNANAVLFIDYNTEIEGFISAKIFEYLYYSKSIIAIGNNPNSSAAKLIKETNSGVYLGLNVDLIEQYLTEIIIDHAKYEYKKNDSIILEYTRENQANKLLNYIIQLN